MVDVVAGEELVKPHELERQEPEHQPASVRLGERALVGQRPVVDEALHALDLLQRQGSVMVRIGVGEAAREAGARGPHGAEGADLPGEAIEALKCRRVAGRGDGG